MKNLIIFTLLIGIALTSCSQTFSLNIQKTDSVKIHFNQLVKATEALIELRNIKKQQGLFEERLHKKDVVIAYYERTYKKLNEADSINTILIKNKDKEIEIKDNKILDLKYDNRKQKTGKIISGITVPVVAVLSFLLGFYIHR